MPNNDTYNEIELNAKYYSTMDNDLIRYQRTLSTSALKLLRIVISQIDTSKDNDLFSYKIGFAELGDILGISKNNLYVKDNNQQYKYVVSLAEQLQQTVCSKHQNNNELVLMAWCPTIKINREEKTLDIKLNQDLKPYLINLQKRFSSIQLKNVMEFRGKYSLRLYEILVSLFNENKRNKNHFTFTVKELRMFLDCMNRYKGFQDFKRYVLLPAIEEINKTSNNAVCDLENIKMKGRTATQVTIYFEEI